MCTNFDFTDNEFEAMLRSVKAWNAPAATPRTVPKAVKKEKQTELPHLHAFPLEAIDVLQASPWHPCPGHCFPSRS